MKPPKNIRDLFVKSTVTVSSEFDEKVLHDTLAAYEKIETSTSLQPSRWGIIMKSKITKYTVAAGIMIAVLTGIYQFAGTIDGTGVTWAQVVEQINRHEKYKCHQRVVRSDGTKQSTMNMYHLNLSQRREEIEDGTIRIFDMRGKDAIIVELDPRRKKAAVTKLLGFGPRKDPDIIAMVKGFEQVSIVRLGTKKQNGKVLHGFRHQPNKYNDFTVWVDFETKLPVEIAIKHPEAGQTILMDEFEFDFTVDPSLFDPKVPAGYKVETITDRYRPVGPGKITPQDAQVEQINRYEKYKCRQRVVRSRGSKWPTMKIYHLNPSQRREEIEDGTLRIVDMRGKDVIIVELDPRRKKAVVTKLLGFGPQKDPDLIAVTRQFEQGPVEKIGTKKQNGKILYGFRLPPNKYNEITVWVDMDTKLPVAMETKHPTAGETIFTDEFEFSSTMDPSLFKTDVPAGYKVETIIKDYRPVAPKR